MGYEIVHFDQSSIDWTRPENGSGRGRNYPHAALRPPKPMRHIGALEDMQSDEDRRVAASQVMQPIGNQVEKIDPIEKSTNLYLEFANTPVSVDGILGFATAYGLLGTGDAHETVDVWRSEIRRLNEGILEWKNLKGGNPGSFAKIFMRLNPCPEGSLTHSLQAGPADTLEQFLEPTSLLAAIWVQFAGAIEGATSFAPCVECTAWIDTVPGSNRPDKIYCSNACRMRAYRKRKVKKVMK